MRVTSNLKRIRTQLSGMERMVRTLRAEVETQIATYAPGDVETATEIGTGFGRMFAEAAPLAARDAQAYVAFFPGVWCGLDRETGGSGATVALKALHSHDPVEGRLRIARLSVNPVFPLVEKPRWMTLECDVDLAALRASKALKLDLCSFFEVGPRNTATLPREVTLTLRIKTAEGAVSDHLGYGIPVSTMPFEHSMRVPDMKAAGLDLAAAATVTLILALPMSGDYIFHMDHFSLQSIKG